MVRKILSATSIQTIENKVKVALQTEKIAKIYGDKIAKQYFIRNAILSKIRL